MKKLFFFFLFYFIINPLLFSQNWEWTKIAGGPFTDKITGITHDHSGNIFVTGYFDSTIVFDSIQLVSGGGTDVFIAKFDADGVFLWAKQIGGQNDDFSSAISTDISGNCYLTGFFFIQGSTTSFGTTTMTQIGVDADVFISKFSAAGKLLWVRNAGGKNEDISMGIATDVSGNCYVTGFFSGTAVFGTTTLTSMGYSDIFIAKYDAAGNLLWVKKGGGRYQDEAYAISTDMVGNCYVAGYFTGNAVFSGTSLASVGYFDNDVFLLKYNPSGVLIWAKRAGGSANDIGYGLDVAKTGEITVCGMFEGTKSFGENLLTRASGSNGFVARFDSNGKLSWARSTNSTNTSVYRQVSTDAAGNCFVAGFISGDVLFGNTNIPSEGGKDVCVVKYDIKGNLMWVLQAGGTEDDEAVSISSDGAGNCYVGGQFVNAATFGRVKVSGWYKQDIFISRIK